MPDEGTWIDLLDPDEATLRRILPDEIHPSASERMLAPPRHGDEPRPRLETHGDHLFGVLVLPVCEPGAEWVEHQEVDVLVSRDRMVTVRKTPELGTAISVDDVRAAANRNNAPPGMCLYHLFDEIA